MTKFKFGDMVTITNEGGSYMVVGPYVGDRHPGDPSGSATWIADIDTEYSRQQDGGPVWTAEEELEPLDDE